jgi:hypothetical protein
MLAGAMAGQWYSHLDLLLVRYEEGVLYSTLILCMRQMQLYWIQIFKSFGTASMGKSANDDFVVSSGRRNTLAVLCSTVL